jgi:hypothetical protein
LTWPNSDAFGQMIGASLQSYSYDALGRTISDNATGDPAPGPSFAYSGTADTMASDGTNTYSYDPGDGWSASVRPPPVAAPRRALVSWRTSTSTWTWSVTSPPTRRP